MLIFYEASSLTGAFKSTHEETEFCGITKHSVKTMFKIKICGDTLVAGVARLDHIILFAMCSIILSKRAVKTKVWRLKESPLVCCSNLTKCLS